MRQEADHSYKPDSPRPCQMSRLLFTATFLLAAFFALGCVSPAAAIGEFVCDDFHYKRTYSCLPALPPDFSIFDNFTNHVAVVTKTQEEYEYQMASYINAGIGPWMAPARFRNINAVYCGQVMEGTFSIDIYLTTSRNVGESPSFWEIFHLVGDVPNYFSDWYDQHGPSIPYHGLQVRKDPITGEPILTPAQFEAWLAERNIPIIFHFGYDMPGGKNAYFIRIGYALAEVVFVNPNPLLPSPAPGF